MFVLSAYFFGRVLLDQYGLVEMNMTPSHTWGAKLMAWILGLMCVVGAILVFLGLKESK